MLSLLWVFVCIIVIIGLAYWFTRTVAGRGKLGVLGGAEKAGAIQIVSRRVIGRDQQLVLVKAGERHFLLGVTAASIQAICEFSAEEAAAFTVSGGPDGGGQPPSFREALQTVLKQRTKR